MSKLLVINKKINKFNKIIKIEGDKSLSIRCVLLASQAEGKSTIKNLLKSDDVLSTIKCLKKLGVKIKQDRNTYEIFGLGLNGFRYKKNLALDAGNSGTLGRLIMGLLVHSDKKIKIIGDESLSKRDFQRVIDPLQKFGASFKSNSGKLPIHITGTNKPTPINYFEKKGSAQCKSAVMLAALNTKGVTTIKSKPSRNHSELLFKYLNLQIKTKRKKNTDFIEVRGGQKISLFNYTIP